MENAISMLQGLNHLHTLLIFYRLLVIPFELSGNLRVEDILIRPTIKFFPRGIERLLSCGICIYIATLHIFDPRQPGEMMHEPRETLLALLQSLLGTLALGDVNGDDDCLPDRVDEWSLLRPIDASLMFRLVADHLTGKVLPQAFFQPRAPLPGKYLC